MSLRENGTRGTFLLVVVYFILRIQKSEGFPIATATGTENRLCKNSCDTSLFGINEWRMSNSERQREVWMLPFKGSEVLLPGERRTIVLNEGRFFDLFQDVMDHEDSVVGMALMGEDFLLPFIMLCEIHDYEIDTGFRGRISIQATLESVGRAEMTELLQMKPVMKAICREFDDIPVTESDGAGMKKLGEDVNKLSMQIADNQSKSRAFQHQVTSVSELNLESIDALIWDSLSLMRDKVGSAALLEIVQSKNMSDRLRTVYRLLQESLSALPEGHFKSEGALFDEPSSFE